MMPTSKTFYFKTIFASICLFVESFIVTDLLYSYAKSNNYLHIEPNHIIIILISLLLITYTYAVSVGAWKNGLQYLTVPMPIATATSIHFLRIDYVYGVLAFFVVYGLLCYDVFFATQLKKQLIKFNPRIVLKFSTKGLLVVHAIIAGMLVLLLAPRDPNALEIPKLLANLVHAQVNLVTSNAYSNPTAMQMLQGLGFFSINYKALLTTQLEQILAPYQDYFVPTVAIIVSTAIQFLNALVYILFALTINPLFYLIRKLGLLHPEYTEVVKEELSF